MLVAPAFAIDPQLGSRFIIKAFAVIIVGGMGSYPGAILAALLLGIIEVVGSYFAGAVIGSGLGKRLASVHWNVVTRIAFAWVVTLPAAAVVGGGAAWAASSGIAGLMVVLVGGLAVCVGLFLLARRRPVSAENVNDEAVDADRIGQRQTEGERA